jgi:glutaredoxin-related protein
MKAIVWSKFNCQHCDQAKALLDQQGIEFEERRIGDGWTKEQLLESVPSARSVPQIFVNDQLIGGFAELQKYLKENVNV